MLVFCILKGDLAKGAKAAQIGCERSQGAHDLSQKTLSLGGNGDHAWGPWPWKMCLTTLLHPF